MTTLTRSRAVSALLTGLSTTAYYAVPDVAHTRASRGWLKTACLAATTVVSLPEVRRGWGDMKQEWQEVRDAPVDTGDPHTGTTDPTTDPTTEEAPDDERRSVAGTAVRRSVAVLTGLTVATAGIAGTVAAERWIFRRGEARAAEGVRFAHTRTAVVLGVASALLTLLEEPVSRRAQKAQGPS